MSQRCWIVIGGALTLAGCMIGPNYHRPQVTVPPQFRSASIPAEASSIAETKWFDLFQDDTLKQLVTTALANNFDLHIAAERVLEARANYRITRAELFPTLDANAGFTASRTSTLGSFNFIPKGSNLSTSFTQAALSLSWEIDLWGRIRRLTEAARAQYLASEEARRGVTISLISEVMNNYFALREQDLELSIGQQTRGIAENNLRLINLRHDRGAASGLDVHQAEQLLYIATSQIESVQRSIGVTEDALSLLLGNTPSDVPRGKPLEQINSAPELPAGLPSSLIERRPDIRQAEQNLIAANAEIGAARALYLPRLSLTGLYGSQSRSLSDMFTGPARLANIGPSAVLPIFRAALRPGVQLTEAQKREMLLTYQRTIYNALREVSDALVVHDRTRNQRIEEEKLVATLTESVRLSDLRYRGGLDSYLQVLDAQRSLFARQLILSQLRLGELQSVVQLYRALGGGWQ